MFDKEFKREVRTRLSHIEQKIDILLKRSEPEVTFVPTAWTSPVSTTQSTYATTGGTNQKKVGKKRGFRCYYCSTRFNTDRGRRIHEGRQHGDEV